VATVLEEGWAKGWAAVEWTAMHFLLPTSWVVEAQAEGHVSRCRLTNPCFVGSKLQH